MSTEEKLYTLTELSEEVRIETYDHVSQHFNDGANHLASMEYDLKSLASKVPEVSTEAIAFTKKIAEINSLINNSLEEFKLLSSNLRSALQLPSPAEFQARQAAAPIFIEASSQVH